jgi:alpha-tubulin suppressor-like RCC1 family protein
MAIKSTGALWAWGANTSGQLGLGDVTNRSSPVQVGTDTNWSSVSASISSSFVLAIKSGQLWAWGYNGSGQLGLGDATARSSPVQVGTDTNWSSVSAGGSHTLVIKTTGSLWAWGINTSGQLGLGDTTARSSPVQVGTDTNWSSVSAGGSHTLAIKSGALWAWGSNTNGRLGLGDVTNRSSPVQVGTDATWSSVSAGGYHAMAIKSPGSLWAWGNNITNGRLGLGDVTNRSSPVQVGTDTNWSSVSAGSQNTLAIKTTGSLWAWGSNTSGQLGLGDTTARSSPVQVGTDTNWSSVSAGSSSFTLARKTDGSLWSWGSRTLGKSGVLIIQNVSSPVQVQTATNWKISPSGQAHNAALKIFTTQNPTT